MPDWIEGHRRGVIEIIERATRRGELDGTALPNLDMFLDMMPSINALSTELAALSHKRRNDHRRC